MSAAGGPGNSRSAGRTGSHGTILGVLALAFSRSSGSPRASGRLAARTAKSGLPLTAEQQSVDFQTADLTFEVLPTAQRIDGRAVLGLLVKAPIAKLQFDLDPELPISAIAADGRALGQAAWKNDGGLVTVCLPASQERRRAACARRRPMAAVPTSPSARRGTAASSGRRPRRPALGRDRGRGRRLRPVLAVLRQQPGRGRHRLHSTSSCPSGLAAPSNGRLLGVDTLADGRTRWNWQARRPQQLCDRASTSRPTRSPRRLTRAASATACRSTIGTCRARRSRRKPCSPRWSRRSTSLKRRSAPTRGGTRRWASSRLRTSAWSTRRSTPTATATSRRPKASTG